METAKQKEKINRYASKIWIGVTTLLALMLAGLQTYWTYKTNDLERDNKALQHKVDSLTQIKH